jgi:hypothetical protein
MDVLYYPPPLASGNITHPCKSKYLGKIFLFITYLVQIKAFLYINSTCVVIKIKYRLRTFLLCRLFTIDWFKPEIITGQYNSSAGISNVPFAGGRGK